MVDRDLAELYEVSTKALNQAVSRNPKRFPKDFMFRLTKKEKDKVVTNCDHLSTLKYSPTNPHAFTEQGVAMLSSVLRSDRAVEVNVEIMRTFVRLRRIIASHEDLARKLAALEHKYDDHFRIVFDAIRELMKPPDPKKKPQIGFRRSKERN